MALGPGGREGTLGHKLHMVRAGPQDGIQVVDLQSLEVLPV